MLISNALLGHKDRFPPQKAHTLSLSIETMAKTARNVIVETAKKYPENADMQNILELECVKQGRAL